MPDDAPSRAGSDNALCDRPCPMCGRQATVDDVEVVAAVRATSVDQETRAKYWRGFRSRSCFFDYSRCAECSLLYCTTYFSGASLQSLYASMPDNTAGASQDVLRRTQEGYIDFLVGEEPLRGTYLEVGPDIGLATAAAKGRGTLDRLVLVEPNRTVHDTLRVVGTPVPTEVVTAMSDVDQPLSADTAVLIHVLDHLTDPLRYLEALHQNLATAARLLVVVHSEASVLRRVLRRRWPPFTLQHPQLFSPDTLSRLVERAGFKVLRVRPTTNYFPLPHAVRTAAAVVGLPTGWTAKLPPIEVPLRLGNIMLVAQA